MPDFTSHADTLIALRDVQSAESDLRDAAREAHLFVDKRDGQWEPYWWEQNEGKPRYTFDQVGPQVDQVAGEMEQSDFDVTIKPAGGDATKDDAKLYDGMIRNIENVSGSADTYDLAARNMVTGGIDGWMVEQKFVDDDSFDQDLVISPIADFMDSCWLGPFKRPDGHDAKYGFLLEAVPKVDYDEKWEDGSGQSVGDDRVNEAYYQKTDIVLVGQVYYVKEEPRELLRMTSGRILEDTDKNKSILDELAEMGDTVEKTRTIKKHVVYSRLFDGADWLNKAQKTVFSQVPLIPVMANFKINEHKILYRGLVEKLFDPQRVFNYTKSREVEEVALSPREKLWMTPKQAAGHDKTLATLNTNFDPVQMYNNDPDVPGPPAKTNGGSVNPGLATVSADMTQLIRQAAGMFDANMGDQGLNGQSGVAIKRLENRGDTGSVKYFRAMERAIRRTGRILVDAIPEVYDTPRQVRILKEDGSFDMTQLNQQVRDQQTGQMVTVNDVSKGKYDVTCTAGPSFQNRQEETVTAITEMAQFDPAVIAESGDILYNNVTSPGMDLVAERKRSQIFKAGGIPETQLTDDEKQQQQAMAQQPPPEDPLMVAAQAETAKAQADMGLTQIKGEAVSREQDRKDWEAQQKAQNTRFDQMAKMQSGMVDQANTQADTLKKIADALGIPVATRTGLVSMEAQTQNLIATQGEVRDQ